MSQRESGYPVVRLVGLVFCLLVFASLAGGVLAPILEVLLFPVVAALVVAPFILLHYWLWGRDFEQEVVKERSELPDSGEWERPGVDWGHDLANDPPA